MFLVLELPVDPVAVYNVEVAQTGSDEPRGAMEDQVPGVASVKYPDVDFHLDEGEGDDVEGRRKRSNDLGIIS